MASSTEDPRGTSKGGAVGSLTTRKRKRQSPFRIKVGCVVALRYKPVSGNHVTMIVPPTPGATTQTKPSKHPLHSLAGTESHAEVWTDPIPGRDDGLALIGRRVRCCFAKEIFLEKKSDSVAGNGASGATSQQVKKTKNIIIEGEIISLVDWAQHLDEEARKQQNVKSGGTVVELLIDRDSLTKAQFLERTDEDMDLTRIKKESARRAYKNEETIKGKNKVMVKVTLEDCSGVRIQQRERGNGGQSNRAKWAIRKRIPNDPGEFSGSGILSLAEATKEHTNGAGKPTTGDKNQWNGMACSKTNDSQGKTNGQSAQENPHGSEATSNGVSNVSVNNNPQPKKQKRTNGNKKSANGVTQYLGNKNDDTTQQQRNWRWLAGRYNDLYLADPPEFGRPAATISNRNTIQFLEHYSSLLQSCGGFIGEVLEVTPSSRAGTLAMVTLRRLILPQHTADGRSSVNKNVTDDYDSLLIGRKKKSDADDAAENVENQHEEGGRDNSSLSSVVFRVPIEELVIVSRQVKRDFQHQTQSHEQSESMFEEIVVNASYSWRANCHVPLKNMIPKKSNNPHVPRALTKKKLKKMLVCHRCRTWQPKKHLVLCDNPNCVVTRFSFESPDQSEPEKVSSFAWCKGCLYSMRGVESVVDQDFDAELEALSELPCCLGLCDCRQCHFVINQRHTEDNLTSAIERACNEVLSNDVLKSLAEDDNSLFGETETMLNSMTQCPFDISSEFVELSSLPPSGSKPITKAKSAGKKAVKSNATASRSAGEKRKKETPPTKQGVKKSKASNARPRTPPPPPDVEVRKRAPRRQSEDYSVFKPTSSRLMDLNTVNATKSLRKEKVNDELNFFSGWHGDKPRNLREVIARAANRDTGDKTDKDEKVLSSRAARANQRRLVKDVASLGASNLSLDTLAGRESQLRFDRSGIHAWGVFADGEVSAEDMIIEYRGELIGNAMAEKREREYELAKIGSDYMFRIDGNVVCDATKQGNVARFINASCDPNCYTKIITHDGKQRIVIYAKKDIKVGEELCYDYKFPLEYDESKRIPCCCGAAECKGYMNWDNNKC